ncbi:MAG: AAA family ATPase [Zoogloeaceae bacterium]|jgi:type II secretory pathway predicted ATPase ExeA|nr:AAA family ATPase [Zoogloeaceae bacterium]
MKTPNRTHSIREIARRAGVDPAVARRAMRGHFPVRDRAAANRLTAALDGVGAAVDIPASAAPDSGGLHAVQIAKEGRGRANDPAPDETPDATDGNDGHSLDDKEQRMLIQRQAIAPAALKHWGLFGSALSAPWQRGQVFFHPENLVIYEHMLSKARYGGLLAVIGESGAGKTIIKDALVGDLVAEGEIDVIEPRTQRMEETDKLGKTLKAGDIVEAIMSELAPGTLVRRTSEAQLRQVGACLAARLADNPRRHVVLIFDEAHCLPKITLRHLKRFLELKDPAKKGLQRPLLSIILLGQPELAVRLSQHDQSVREVWQRCEIVHMHPLDGALDAYVKHRLGDAARAFAPEALARLAACLIDRHGVSYLYPLAVDNWLALILNRAAGLAKTITGDLVDEIAADVRRGK